MLTLKTYLRDHIHRDREEIAGTESLLIETGKIIDNNCSVCEKYNMCKISLDKNISWNFNFYQINTLISTVILNYFRAIQMF